MQTAVALCYFCENHGSRVVVVCQPMRNCELPRPNSANSMGGPIVNDHQPQQQQPSTSSFVHCQDCDGDGNAAESPRLFTDFFADNEVVDDEARCAACSSFEHGVGLMSKDGDAEISYISTQVPRNERLGHLLRQASLRSLSVEISVPLPTTDRSHSNHIDASPSSSSSDFRPKCDQRIGNVRDFTERDGIVLFGDDEHWYTLSYIFRLKDARARGFHRYCSLVVISADKLLLLRNYDFLVHKLGEIIGDLQHRTGAFFALEQQRDSELRLASNVSHSSKGPQHWLPHHFYPMQHTVDTKRSLKVITDSEQIFEHLHSKMLDLLKTLKGLDKDIVLEGCPTQDMLTAMEMEQSDSSEERELIAQLSPRQSLIHLANLRIIVDRLNCNDELSTLIWHVVIGGQVLARSASRTARCLFLLSLVQLVPVGCVRMAMNSKQYTFPHEHNFVGCSLSVRIPSEILSDVFVVTLSETERFSVDDADQLNFSSNSLEPFDLRVESLPHRSKEEKPSIVDRYCQLFLDPIINDLTLASAIQSTRNDWLNKAKLIFQLKKQRNAIDLNRVIGIIKCQPKDSPVILFWQKGLAKHYQQAVESAACKHAAKVLRRSISGIK
ncbi:hypothetical protein niasHS_007369 [Heterodera schachtii]|uniref:Folliculin n=1 Tax=Heterodera schachtii TaxID=97005 RepID=A0ABD2JX99_HETSC